MKKLYLIFTLLSTLALKADMTTDIKKSGLELINNVSNFLESPELSLNEEREKALLNSKQKREERSAKAWNDIFDNLEESVEYIDKIENAPESSFFGSDKNSLKNDMNKQLEKIIEALSGDVLSAYKEEYEDTNEKILETKADISVYRTKKVGAPQKSLVHTTKEGYTKKIKDAQDQIKIYENDIIAIQTKLKNNFEDIGVKLQPEQIDVLLKRVDGNDILQMSLVLELLQDITKQVLKLVNESDEGLAEAKQFYGMNLITFEVIVYIQQTFIDKVNNVYIPKIDKLISKAELSIKHSIKKIKSATEKVIKNGYKNNLKNKEFNLEVITSYRKKLIEGKKQVADTQKKAVKRLDLAKDTYFTVSMSFDIQGIKDESQKDMQVINDIQMPEIVPFENIKIKNEYEKITKSIMIQE